MVKTFKALNLSNKVNKVFIIPNNLGLYFIGLWATCFLLSVGYASNLLLFMAIMQFAIFFWWMITAHADTKHLKVDNIFINSPFAETNTNVNIQWNNKDLAHHLKKIILIDKNKTQYLLDINNNYKCSFQRRGQFQFIKMLTELQTGFWLFKTWKYHPINFQLIVYPKPIKPPSDIFINQQVKNEEHHHKKITSHATELDLQREADVTTKANRINWKRFAQRGLLVERIGESGYQQQEIFELDKIYSELQLSYLTYEIWKLYETGNQWYIKQNAKIYGPFNINGKNKDDLHQCLSLLATYSW